MRTVETALAAVELLRAERFGELEARFAPVLRAAVSAETVRVAWTAELAAHGAVREIGAPSSEPGAAGATRVRVPVSCANGGLTVVLSVEESGLLNGMRIATAESVAWTPPGYAAPRKIIEREVRLGPDELAVSGTLSLPTVRGPVPGVVMLGASGPVDRDETVGPNKPVKDLAWGLAARGIAVLRYDSLGHAHPETAARTAAEQYLPYARAGIETLRAEPSVDPARIFLAGHSMGGSMAPRVAAAEPVAGLVLLAPGGQPMHRSYQRVARYLAGANGSDEETLAAIDRQVALVDRPDLGPDTPTADLPLALPASYWLDLLHYDAPATAAAFPGPILILQGGRDYQVTLDDDLALWQAGLAGHAEVTTRVLAEDDHLFFAGSGRSTPEGYQSPQHLDRRVVDEIADWIEPPSGALSRLRKRFR